MDACILTMFIISIWELDAGDEVQNLLQSGWGTDVQIETPAL